MNRYCIVADDFTGSNDTGVQLSRRGLRTRVVLRSSGIGQDDISYVLDTESRNIPGEEAGALTAKLLEGVDLSAFDCVIKKVDSTLRGNIPEEIAEVDRAYGSDLVIFMPALPGLDRTTENSIHKLNGVRIGLTELARDPRKPVLQDNIAEILRLAFSEPVGQLHLEQIRSGRIDLSGARLWACDAVTDGDMQLVIAAARRHGRHILWVGTAAIADNLLEDEAPQRPALAVIASVSDVARQQIRHAEEKGLRVLQLDIPALLRGEAPDYVAEAVSILESGRNLAFVSSASYDRDALNESVREGKARGMDRDAVAEFTSTEISRMAAEILDRVQVSGLFLSGGDTAIHFLNCVGAEASEIVFELTVGIPLMRLAGGRFDGLKVITKAGAFGSVDALPMIMRKLGEA